MTLRFDRSSSGVRVERACDAARSARGQSMVEFTLLAPLLLVLLLGIADFGRVFAAGIVVEAAARNAAEIAASEYLRNPPGPLASPAPVPGPAGYYQALHQNAARVVCTETKDLANSRFDRSSGTCASMPVVLVCVHDGADDQCGTEPFGAPIPEQCSDLRRAMSNAQDGGAERSRYVEVRICYRFSMLFKTDFLPLGEVYLQRSRAFTVADY
jgi:hypothetical protein